MRIFSRSLQIIWVKNPTQYIDRSNIWNPPQPSKFIEGDAVQATQEILKLIEDSQVAKLAHIA